MPSFDGARNRAAGNARVAQIALLAVSSVPIVVWANQIPAWMQLHRRLVALQEAVQATNVMVCDLSSCIMCYGLLRGDWGLIDLASTERQLERDLPRIADMFEQVLRARPRGKDKPGMSFTVALADAAPFAYAQSFAGVYVLLFWFEGPFIPFRVAGKVREALPEIEALTVMLPPPDGPERGAVAMRKRR